MSARMRAGGGAGQLCQAQIVQGELLLRRREEAEAHHEGGEVLAGDAAEELLDLPLALRVHLLVVLEDGKHLVGSAAKDVLRSAATFAAREISVTTRKQCLAYIQRAHQHARDAKAGVAGQ